MKRKRIAVGFSYDDVLLVPNLSHIATRKSVDVSTELTKQISLHIPVISANVPWCTGWRMAAAMANLGGLGIIHRMTTPQKQAREIRRVKSLAGGSRPYATTNKAGRLLVGAAVGVKGDYLDRSRLLVDSGADILLVDVAHGHSGQTLHAIGALREMHPGVEIVAGNVATSRGTRDLIRAGASAIKVGIGPGGICSTRVVTGCGVPQITAIMECAEVAREHKVPVIADGGIRASGDITKAIAAGASCVMLGSILAGAEESAALLIRRKACNYKVTTGFATLGMRLTLRRANNERFTADELTEYVPEGVEATFPYTGPVEDTVTQCVGGLKSGMSYCGAASICELWEKAKFIQVSPSGFTEGTPHVLGRFQQLKLDYRNYFIAEANNRSRGQLPTALRKRALSASAATHRRNPRRARGETTTR